MVDDSPDPARPLVSVVIPVLNEGRHIAACLESLQAQTIRPDEILVVDGGSSDATQEIAARFNHVTVLDNPQRLQSAALNIGLAATRGDVIIRVDGHVRLAPDYVQRCVTVLERGDVAMVGGAMTPAGSTWKQRGVAAAMTSPFGAGPARFHVGGKPGWVDTVYLGAYRRVDALDAGGYREWLVTNEDAEFAHRMRRRGGIWFDPAIRSSYEPRDRFALLGRQFFRYGRGRATTVRLDPTSLSPRQLPAPALTLALATRWRGRVAAGYSLGVLLLGLFAGRTDRARGLAFTVALPVMHLTWGMGFLVGLVQPYGRTSCTSESAEADRA